MDDDCPPSYEDVMNQVRVLERPVADSPSEDFGNDRQKTYWFFLRINFTIFDIAISILAFLVYIAMITTNVFDVIMINVKELCKDDGYKYDRPYVNVGFGFTYFGLATVFTCTSLTTFIGVSWRCEELPQILSRILRKLWIVSICFLFLCIEVHALQLSFGVPRPFYFSDSKLNDYYCSNGYKTLSVYMRDTDREWRMSFPSFTTSADCFSTAFLLFYLDHFDVGLGPHTAQFIILVLFGSKCVTNAVLQYDNHEHHATDILGGAVLGILAAAFTVRNLKGTVLRNVSALPKYVTNGMLFDRLRRISRNFFSFGQHSPERNRERIVRQYEFPIDYHRNEQPSAPPIV